MLIARVILIGKKERKIMEGNSNARRRVRGVQIRGGARGLSAKSAGDFGGEGLGISLPGPGVLGDDGRGYGVAGCLPASPPSASVPAGETESRGGRILFGSYVFLSLTLFSFCKRCFTFFSKFVGFSSPPGKFLKAYYLSFEIFYDLYFVCKSVIDGCH